MACFAGGYEGQPLVHLHIHVHETLPSVPLHLPRVLVHNQPNSLQPTASLQLKL